MTAAELKASILDRAVRGLLVPQDPREGTAADLFGRVEVEKCRNGRARTPTAPDSSPSGRARSPSEPKTGGEGLTFAASFETTKDLLAKIAAEKKHLLATGKIKKQKPLPPITDDEKPFPIPDGWEWVRWGEIVDTQLGKMLDSAKSKGVCCKYLANFNVQWNAFNLSEIRETLFKEGEPEKFNLIENDILMCEGGEPGRCAIWNNQIHNMKFQKALHRLRSYGIEPRYIVIFFEVATSCRWFRELLTGETIKHLPKDVLITIPIPLPPLTEQKEIVARVEELLSLVGEMKRP